MPITIDASRDYEVWDNTEDITYVPAPRGPASFPVTSAKQRALTYSELMQDNGAYVSQDSAWLLPVLTSKALTDVQAMKRGDAIRDARNTLWTVLSVQLGKWKNTWKLITRNLVLVEGLRDSVTIVRPGISQGAGSEAIFGGQTIVAQDLAARVQPISAERVVMNEIEGVHTRFSIVLGQDVTLQAQDRILFGGRVLQFERITGLDRLGMLPVVDAVEVGA